MCYGYAFGDDDSNMQHADTPTDLLRPATGADVPAIERLIDVSVRELSANDYSAAQIEGALRVAMGVDTQLIADGTYFAIEHLGEVIACGGWSYRQTLFGADAESARDASELDPATDAARIRAFFVAPAHARRGLGSRLMAACEAAARARGFSRLQLMATLPGKRLYERHGFVADAAVDYALGDGVTIVFVPMHKTLE